jgi:Na+-translocating ferredoxin:NAD+ oxidoreductase subunit B
MTMNNIMIVTVEQIDQILPQTQCTKCGYDDCLEYARAIKRGTPHNQCPPGGNNGIQKLSMLLHREPMPLNPSNGALTQKKVAVINEDLCIGCKKCILACPVDAIIGSGKLMHTVIASECTGCDLCVEPCPMDCIDMVELPQTSQLESLSVSHKNTQANHYRQRHEARQLRLETQKSGTHTTNKSVRDTISTLDKKAYIQQALADFRAKKQKTNRS